VKKATLTELDAGSGRAILELTMPDELFYKILSERSGLDITDDKALISMIQDLGRIKRDYERIEAALKEVELKGYGIVMPTIDEMALDEPEIVKQGSRFGVKLRAKAPSLHLIKANIETEISPFVGTEKQSEELVDYILKEFEDDPTSIWTSNLFGKPLNELMSEGLQNPIVFFQHYNKSKEEKGDFQLESAADMSALLFDGFTDGIMLLNLGNLSADDVDATAFGILQAARLRTSKTEYISCPGCGRTLYNLEETIAKIKAATSHLKGLKIGIMGCIVNGPGEMADADYGYVGAGRGKISLYKKKECIEKNIPEEEAVERLLKFIAENENK
jgi:hypothetical protein